MNYFLYIRTSQIRKVPSFGATNQSSNRQEVNSSSAANKGEGTKTEVESNRSSTSETNNRQKEVNMECGDITDQDQTVQTADERENQEEKEDQGAVNLAMDEDVKIVETSVDGELSYKVRSKRNAMIAMKYGKSIHKIRNVCKFSKSFLAICDIALQLPV